MKLWLLILLGLAVSAWSQAKLEVEDPGQPGSTTVQGPADQEKPAEIVVPAMNSAPQEAPAPAVQAAQMQVAQEIRPIRVDLHIFIHEDGLATRFALQGNDRAAAQSRQRRDLAHHRLNKAGVSERKLQDFNFLSAFEKALKSGKADQWLVGKLDQMVDDPNSKLGQMKAGLDQVQKDTAEVRAAVFGDKTAKDKKARLGHEGRLGAVEKALKISYETQTSPAPVQAPKIKAGTTGATTASGKIGGANKHMETPTNNNDNKLILWLMGIAAMVVIATIFLVLRFGRGEVAV